MVDPIGPVPDSRGFSALLAAYRASGGTARGDDVAGLMDEHGLANFIGLARLIAAGRVLGFRWRDSFWIPMFQFDLQDLSIKPEAGRVGQELGSGFDGWARAAWFARPNVWLGGCPPVDMLATDLKAVLAAARTDRFVAEG